jgi:hypothetical protein
MNTIWKYRNKEIYGKYPTGYESDMLFYISNKLNIANCLNKKCVEFGASDGIANSNTRMLILDGWSSVQIEPGNTFKSLESLYKDNHRVKCLNTFVSCEPNNKNSFDTLMELYFVPNVFDIDILSIDVDSCDFSIFQSIQNYLPKIVLVENNSHLPNHKNEGMTSMTKMANEKGYELLGYTGNLIYCHRKYLEFIDLKIVKPEEAWEEYWNENKDNKTFVDYMTKVVDINSFWKL